MCFGIQTAAQSRIDTNKMLSKVGNPALSSLTAVLAATGLRLSVKLIKERQQKAPARKPSGIKPIKGELQAA